MRRFYCSNENIIDGNVYFDMDINLPASGSLPYGTLGITADTPQPEGGPSAWGSAALLSAVDEGLAGIVDTGVRYDTMDFSPRFPVTYYTELRYITGYEKTSTVVDVRWILEDMGMRYDIYAPSKKINAHIMLPKGKKCTRLLVNDVETFFVQSRIKDSDYVDATIWANGKYSKIEVIF